MDGGREYPWNETLVVSEDTTASPGLSERCKDVILSIRSHMRLSLDFAKGRDYLQYFERLTQCRDSTQCQ
jgi:hypothetical protein